MIIETRREFKTATGTPKVISELLQMIFSAELLKSSDNPIWIVSPWLSNVELFDNRSGYFSAVSPDWPCTGIRLIDVLVELMKQGTMINIVVETGQDKHNDKFRHLVKSRVRQEGIEDRFKFIKSDNLHTKGFLFDRGFLAGSMNLTFNGLEVNDEFVIYDISSVAISEARLAFDAYLESSNV